MSFAGIFNLHRDVGGELEVRIGRNGWKREGTKLVVSREKLFDNCLGELGESLIKFDNLLAMTVDTRTFTLITEEGLSRLFNGVGANATRLEELRLRVRGQGLGQSALGDLAVTLCSLSELERVELDLCGWTVADDGISKIATALGHTARLVEFVLMVSGTGITNEGAQELLDSLGDLVGLDVLSVCFQWTGVSPDMQRKFSLPLQGRAPLALTDGKLALPSTTPTAPGSREHSRGSEMKQSLRKHRDGAGAGVLGSAAAHLFR